MWNFAVHLATLGWSCGWGTALLGAFVGHFECHRAFYTLKSLQLSFRHKNKENIH